MSQDQREELPLQVISRPFDPSNVFYGTSQDENRNPQVQVSGAQGLRAQKVLLRQTNSPPPVAVVDPRPPDMPEPKYVREDPPAECDIDTQKKISRAEGLWALTPVDKGMTILQGTTTSLVPNPSQDQRKN